MMPHLVTEVPYCRACFFVSFTSVRTVSVCSRILLIFTRLRGTRHCRLNYLIHGRQLGLGLVNVVVSFN